MPAARERQSILPSRFGRRLFLLFLGCALLPLLLFAWLVVTQVGTELHEQNDRDLRAATKAVGMSLAEKLLFVLADLDLVCAELLRTGPGSLQGLPAALRERLQMQFAAIAIRTAAGDRIEFGARAPAVPTPTGAGRDHLDAGGTLLVVEPPAAPGAQALLAFARLLPALGPEAMLLATARHDELFDAEDLRSDGAEVLVLDGSGRVLLTTVAELPDLPLLTQMVRQGSASGTLRWQLGGETHTAGFRRLFLRPRLGVDLVIAQSRADSLVQAPLHGFQRGILLTSLTTLLGVAIASLTYIRRTLRPIAALRAATQRVADGALDAAVPSPGSDEIGDLGRSFNHMTDQLRDHIRRREQTERELMAARDAALTAARAKAQFLTNVSHELRTPMTMILSYAEILQSLADEDQGMLEESVAVIATESQKLASMIEQVLALESCDQSQLGPVEVPATLAAAVAALPAATAARVRLQCAPELPPALGSSEQLLRLWGHLLDNASKFSPASAPIEVSVAAAVDRVVVAITDHGEGIDAADQQRIFEPFVQVGRDILTDKARGVGLGLTLAAKIVDRHDGRIEVDSAPGRGSTFRVWLPTAVRSQSPAGASR